MGAGGAIRLDLGGTARVYCVHDRQKRQVTTDRQVADLAAEVGQRYDPSRHKLFECACCQNLFVDETDIPRLCSVCMGSNVHRQEGQLPDPTGAL